MANHWIGYCSALGSAASWALGTVLLKKWGNDLSSSSMTLVKSLLSTVLLGAALIMVGASSMSARALACLVVSGIIGIAAGDTLFFAALKELSPHSLIILLAGGQIVTILLAVVFLGEMPEPVAWLGILLVVTGITSVLWSAEGDAKSTARRRGIFLGALSVLCMSVSLVIAKVGIGEVSAIQGTFIRMLAGLIAMLLFNAVGRRTSFLRENALAPFAHLNVLSRFCTAICVVTFGGFWLSLLSIKHLPVSIANTLGSTEPIFVLPLGLLFLKEKPTLKTVFGSLVTFVGIALICL